MLFIPPSASLALSKRTVNASTALEKYVDWPKIIKAKNRIIVAPIILLKYFGNCRNDNNPKINVTQTEKNRPLLKESGMAANNPKTAPSNTILLIFLGLS